jgi:hypothetical protein
MDPDPPNPHNRIEVPSSPCRWRKITLWAVVILLLYLVVAYVHLPASWRLAIRRHPKLSVGPRITHTANGIPGDAVKLALVGSEADVVHAMTAAGWFPADAITFRSSVRIAVDSVFRRPDEDAPVSDLFLFGRKQDLAYEQPIGDNPRKRHHIRFWRWDRLHDGRPVGFGTATFDERVGFSHNTGQVDVDAKRDRILRELQKARQTDDVHYMDHVHQDLQGRNGGGDPWHTDGRLGVAMLVALSLAWQTQKPD